MRISDWSSDVCSSDLPEAEMLSEVAVALGKTAPVSFRVNPDVDAGTHRKISTGKAENKFGVPISRALDAYALAARLPGLDPLGVAVHIGSQLTQLGPLEASSEQPRVGKGGVRSVKSRWS